MVNKFSFADRCDWKLSSNQITLLHEDLKARKTEIIDLTISNPTQCGFDYDGDILLSELTRQENLNYIADAQGLSNARNAICQMYASQGVEVDPLNIILTASTSEAYAYVFRLLANPGDTILFPSPSYPLFDFLGGLNDVAINKYALKYDGEWRMDMADFVEQLHPRARAVVIVNPNNPTGSYISPAELEHLNKVCVARNMALISDEVFADYYHTSEPGLSVAGNLECLTFTFGGLSKLLGLPQMKLAWIILSGPKGVVESARNKLQVITDTFLSVNTPVQNALGNWLVHKEHIQGQIRQRVRANLEFLRQETSALKGSSLLNTKGGWYAILKVNSSKSEEEWVLKLLGKYNVFVHPGYFYDIEGGVHLVVSLLPQVEIFKAGILRLLSRIEQSLHG